MVMSRFPNWGTASEERDSRRPGGDTSMTGSDVITPGSLSSEAGGNFREVQDQLALEPWWFAGVLIEFVSTFSGTIGKQSWRLAAIASPGPIALVWKRPVALSLYAVGIFLTLCEPPLDSIALTLAPMSIISTCAGLSVAWNVILAPCTLGEQLTVVRVLAAAAIVAGTILMGIFGPHSEVSRTGQQYIEIMGRPMASIYYMLLLSLIGVLAYLTRRYPTRGIYPAMLAGALVGNQFLLKVATELLSCGLLGPSSAPGCTSSNPLLDWEFWAIATAALTISVGGLTILSLTLRDAEALDIIPVYQGTVRPHGCSPPMASQGLPWPSMAFRGLPWPSMASQ